MKVDQSKALKKLGKHSIVHIHSDGDLTIKKKKLKYVVTTEGDVFKEVKV